MSAATMAEDQTKTKGLLLWNMQNIQANNQSIQWIRSFMSIATGMLMGILGLTGFNGFIGFACCHVVINVGILLKSGMKIADFVPGHKLPNFLIDGLLGELLSFMLFWTMFYGLVHVY